MTVPICDTSGKTSPLQRGQWPPQPAPDAAAEAPQSPPVARPVARKPSAGTGEVSLPELSRGWMHAYDDVKPILPDPPPPRATYEDRSGAIDL